MTRADFDSLPPIWKDPDPAARAEEVQKRIEETEAALKGLRSVKLMIEEDAENRGWIRCPHDEAEQYRSRVLTGSIGLECPWEEWQWGVPERCPMHRQFEYRRRRTRREIFEADRKAREAVRHRPYEEMQDDEINSLVISRIMKWTCQRGCDDRWPKWSTPEGIIQGPDAVFRPASDLNHALRAYRNLEGPYELTLEELKIPGPDWYAGIEIYEPKPEKTISAKNDKPARAVCIAMLQVLDADPRMQKCSVCGHQPRHVDDLCEHVRGPL